MPETIAIAQDERLEISGFILEKTAKKMKQAFQRLLKDLDAGITADQWVVLDTLYKHNNGISQMEIGEIVYKDAATLTRIIDILCDKGLTERTLDINDRRRFIVCLTSAGKTKVKELLPAIRAFRRQGWSGLSTTQMEDLKHILDRVFNNYE